ncbi:hypothetical protein Acsp01_00810 [Actinoplanes sp. NBRC 101535]|nr:hypothetical protein Acsp01_00810 [Actinoplanes sp. NBRC 101535]
MHPAPSARRELHDHPPGRPVRCRLPRTVDFTTAPPRDPNGELYKRLLRDAYRTGRDRAIRG